MKRFKWMLYSGLGFLVAYSIGLAEYGWNYAVISLGILSFCLIVADLIEQVKKKNESKTKRKVA